MKFSPVLAALPFVSVPVFAVYAPIPEQQQGKAFTVSLGAGLYYDSNIFGASSGEIDSMVYNASGSLAFNASVTDQTFFSAAYDLSVDHVQDRPGDKNLDNHTLSARLAQTFSPASNLEIGDTYRIVANPASTLQGVPVNADQSYKSNQFDLRLNADANEKTSVTLKTRWLKYDYDSAQLSSLDRSDWLAGISGSYALLPETKLVAEYRYQDISYDQSGSVSDKTSNFFLAGVDYSVGPRTSLSGRVGVEQRNRAGLSDDNAPYVQITGKYDLGAQAYVSGGYTYSYEETSDIAQFSDAKVHRFFVNYQQPVTDLIIASASGSYFDSSLQRRVGSSVSEDGFTLGFALTYLPATNWSVSATVDFDKVNSDISYRDLDRSRVGANVSFVF